MSPELETLDQLQGGNLSLAVIVTLFPSQDAFERGVLGLLSCGDVALTTLDGTETPEWRWRDLVCQHSVCEDLKHLQLKITPQGARRIG